jgi:hypothetical protein
MRAYFFASPGLNMCDDINFSLNTVTYRLEQIYYLTHHVVLI